MQASGVWHPLIDAGGCTCHRLDGADRGGVGAGDCFRYELTLACPPERANRLLNDYSLRLRWDADTMEPSSDSAVRVWTDDGGRELFRMVRSVTKAVAGGAMYVISGRGRLHAFR